MWRGAQSCLGRCWRLCRRWWSGVLAHDFIKTVLFESPMLIAIMLIIGGVILLFVDRYRAKAGP
jgi:undecaprenyl pyrophosphate phosphatase UppP